MCWLDLLGSRCPDRARGTLGGMCVRAKGGREQRKAGQVFRLWGGSEPMEGRCGQAGAQVGRSDKASARRRCSNIVRDCVLDWPDVVSARATAMLSQRWGLPRKAKAYSGGTVPGGSPLVGLPSS